MKLGLAPSHLSAIVPTSPAAFPCTFFISLFYLAFLFFFLPQFCRKFLIRASPSWQAGFGDQTDRTTYVNCSFAIPYSVRSTCSLHWLWVSGGTRMSGWTIVSLPFCHEKTPIYLFVSWLILTVFGSS